MTRMDILRELLDEYAERKRMNVAELESRMDNAFKLDPFIRALRNEGAQLALNSIKNALFSGTEKSREIANFMRTRSAELNAEIKKRLEALSLPGDYLEERYTCEKCRDTGYVGDAPAVLCDCVKRELARRTLGDDGACNQTFERFNLNVFSDETLEGKAKTQREHMSDTRTYLEGFADAYPNVEPYMHILIGAGGLGKTYLMNCIYERIVKNGYEAVRLTAYRMFEAMRQRHMSGNAGEDAFAMLTDAPILFIDDLGTEPDMRNITIEYLFMLMNERLARRRHTVIATNLTPVQLKERYGERVASRLFDKTLSRTLQFLGKDVRLT